TRVSASVGTSTRTELGATATARAGPVTLVAGTLAGSTVVSTLRYSSVVNGFSPFTQDCVVVPGGCFAQASVHLVATVSAAAGALDSGSAEGVSSATGGSRVGRVAARGL